MEHLVAVFGPTSEFQFFLFGRSTNCIGGVEVNPTPHQTVSAVSMRDVFETNKGQESPIIEFGL